jgi:heme-degrading monooxygenase HmoA
MIRSGRKKAIGRLFAVKGWFDVVLEVAILAVRAGQGEAFEAAFGQAAPIIASMKGYLGHELQRCLEVEDKYLLLVKWETLEDHTVGFRGSAEYQDWKALLHHFYDPFPVVEHYVEIARQPVPVRPRRTPLPVSYR